MYTCDLYYLKIVLFTNIVFYARMFKCIKCNKDFKYESEFKRHMTRKKSCDIPKKYFFFMEL